MYRSLALSFVLAACATTAPPEPPEAPPLEPAPAPVAATPPATGEAAPAGQPADVEPAPPASEAPPAPPTPQHRIERAGHIVSIARIDQPCPFVEYSTEWKGLRLRSDRADCKPHKLTESAQVAAELVDALARELGSDFQPQSFGMNDYPELYQRIAIAAKSAPNWNLATGKPRQGSVNEFVTTIAKDASTFYPELVALFAPRKLAPEFSSVEKVFVGKVAETPFAAALREAGLKDSDKVPYGSIVWFRLNEL